VFVAVPEDRQDGRVNWEPPPSGFCLVIVEHKVRNRCIEKHGFPVERGYCLPPTAGKGRDDDDITEVKLPSTVCFIPQTSRLSRSQRWG